MAGRRITYGLLLGSGTVLYLCYREWMAGLLLAGLIALPWLSLVISLPAMLAVEVGIKCPEVLTAGETGAVSLVPANPRLAWLPMPPARGKILVTHVFSGKTWKLRSGTDLPAEHCGGLRITPCKPRVYDYLGLFSKKITRISPGFTVVYPVPMAMRRPPDVTRYLDSAWKPKSGGGFAENHELRLYRPGDSLHQIHWKLTAKTGKLIFREPMEPIRGLALLEMVLSGEPEVLDRKFGRLLWLSEYLLDRQLPHVLRCLTGEGVRLLPVTDREEVRAALAELLACPAAQTSALPELAASWQYMVGGEPDEA